MDQMSIPRHIGWQRSVERVSTLLTIVILTLSLTACMAVVAYRLSGGIALVLAQWMASIGALLHFSVVVVLAKLVARASRIWKHLQSGGKRTAQLKQLRAAILRATGMTVLMGLLTIAAAAVPISLNVVMRVPESGSFFLLLVGALVLHSVNVKRICRRLAELITAAQQVAQHMLVV
ncbi:hypothetical protein FZ025_21025 [Xanthomonas hyacinthi]|uniref:Uncharacterized protein n=1 Tax=Xanthomonas hyacinthi TaxID=56455 RepID=A0A2S7EYV2_9XANT|nr:hypothetical protein [Xanthomonas hyacinthi]KLD77913.1 hypothetical protein Y886_13250 [Xanthomonas hyacinthi DSM 19077]PPU98349.1 hypothetical protein XhyaCFBP1156_06350 [Xanthomonas hyacinthi]QGY78973.1 hypothetical protein FZ025_21025 [Xanthomonas hyacinthi]